jgi:uncharacterized protein
MKPSRMGPSILISLVLLAAVAALPAPGAFAQTPPAASTQAPPAAAAQTPPQAAGSTDHAAMTKALLQLMLDGKFEEAHARLSADGRKAVTPARLGEIWKSLTGEAGAFVGFGQPTPSTLQGMQVIDLPTQFATVQITWRVVWNAQGEAAGLTVASVVPFEVAPSTAPGQTPIKPRAGNIPAYIDSTRFRNEAVSFGAAPWTLNGTLCLPTPSGAASRGAQVPAIILVHGSGSSSGDRDETIGPNKPFRDLAGGLASRGIAVLRYDKRTFAHGAQMDVRRITVEDEILADVTAAIELLKTRKEIDRKRIFVLGHSLGGTVAPIVGERHPDLAGLILLAAGSRPLLPVMAEQIEYIRSLSPGAPAGAADSILAQIKLWMDPSLPDTMLVMGGGVSLGYFRDLDRRNVTQVAAALKMPILVLQGERDYQVTTADFDLWKSALAGDRKATFKLYPDLNHLFMKGTGKATPSEYAKAGFVSPEVIGSIVDWVHLVAR